MPKKNKPPQYLLDVCILTSGRVDLFEKCLTAVLEQIKDIQARLYIFVNSPPDETLTKYQQVCANVPSASRVIWGKSGMLGYPAACNKVMKAGLSPLILLVTDDVILHPNCINTLIERMNDETIGLCGLKLLFPDESTDTTKPSGKVQHIGHMMNIRGEVQHALIGWSTEHPKCNISRDVFSVTGAAFIIRRHLFYRAHCFYEGYGKGTFEDVDLALTLRRMTVRIYIDTNAIGTHYVGATATMLKQPFPLAQNMMILQQRHLQDFVWDEWTFW